jgi:hypothetical protein
MALELTYIVHWHGRKQNFENVLLESTQPTDTILALQKAIWETAVKPEFNPSVLELYTPSYPLSLEPKDQIGEAVSRIQIETNDVVRLMPSHRVSHYPQLMNSESDTLKIIAIAPPLGKYTAWSRPYLYRFP